MKVKAGRILWIVLAVAALAAGVSQAVFLAHYPYFRQYAAVNGVSLREARKVWGHPDEISETAMGLAVEASRENWPAVAALAKETAEVVGRIVRKRTCGSVNRTLLPEHRHS